MNFTQELSQFQGSIVSADNVYSFAKLSAKGGNENEIVGVIETIENFLEQRNFTSNGEVTQNSIATVRKFAFYLVLNADLPALNEMVELDGIDSVIWTVPTIPQCLLCEIMWNTHMDMFVYEIISSTHPQLGLQVLEAFLDNFKYFDPLECIDKMKTLSAACYNVITRLCFLNSDAVDITAKATATLMNFKKCLNFFTCPPNEYKLNELVNEKLFEYFGERLRTMLVLITYCLEGFNEDFDGAVLGSDAYFLTYKEGSLKKNYVVKLCDIQNNVLMECLNECHMNLLDTCKSLVMDVSVDVFCCWSEIEGDGKTMQQVIGEICYKVLHILLSINTTSEHPLVDMLKQLARKPEEIKNIINATPDELILEKINEPTEERKEWLLALLHKENLCQKFDLVKVISCNLKSFDQEQSKQLYAILNEFADSNCEYYTFIETLKIQVFHQCSVPTKYLILDEHFKNNSFVNLGPESNFNDSMIVTFNKLIATPDADLTDVLTLFLQNPQKVYAKIFQLATENVHQTDVMLKVMRMLEKYSNYCYNTETVSSIMTITTEILNTQLDTIAKEDNFVKFMCGLKEADIITGPKLLLLTVMPNLHKALIDKNIDGINLLIKLLRKAYTLEELLVYRAPMLAMMATVLDVVRWKMNTFSANAPKTLSKAIELQKDLFETYQHNVIPEKELDWLKSKIPNLHPLNMYYYRALWHPPGGNYYEVLSGYTGKKWNKIEASSWMAQVIPFCTESEWAELWDCLKKYDDGDPLDAFLNAIGMITLAEKPHRTEASAACTRYCYRNHAYIIRNKYLGVPDLAEHQIRDLVSHIAVLVELAKDNFKEAMPVILLPMLAYLTDKRDGSVDQFMIQLRKIPSLRSMIDKIYKS